MTKIEKVLFVSYNENKDELILSEESFIEKEFVDNTQNILLTSKTNNN